VINIGFPYLCQLSFVGILMFVPDQMDLCNFTVWIWLLLQAVIVSNLDKMLRHLFICS